MPSPLPLAPLVSQRVGRAKRARQDGWDHRALGLGSVRKGVVGEKCHVELINGGFAVPI